MMPASYTMDTIPQPTDPAVVIRQVPAHRAAVIRYSGFWSEEKYREHLEELKIWIDAEKQEVIGQPVWARYNAPFTPWFMRRNEILIPVM
jgi:effector-binding domain-containing protein